MAQSLTKIQNITKATTTTDVQNSRRFGALIPAKQITEKSNRIGHDKRCHAIRVWWGLFKKKSFEGSNPEIG